MPDTALTVEEEAAVEAAVAEATAPRPVPMDLRAIGFAGARRRRALEAASHELDVIADAVIAAGDRANVKLAAKLAGVARDTIYARVAARQGAGS